MFFQELSERIQGTETYLIYGAGIVAYGVMAAIETLFHKKAKYSIVTRLRDNVSCLAGVPVRTPDKIGKEDWNYPVFVAVPEIYHRQIKEKLKTYTGEPQLFFDSESEYQLMKEYFRKIGGFALLEDLRGNDECDRYKKEKGNDGRIAVYMAKSHRDKQLANHYKIPGWIEPVQAGAAGTDIRMNIQADNTGDNISWKNPDYCELTVAYWAWKNKSSRYKGICHYRRMLKLTEWDIRKCMEHNIDAVLPLPFVCYPNATGQYKRYISESDRKNVEKAIHDISPEYVPALNSLDTQPFFYNYNMVIAKEDVFNEYCGWMFKILERAETYCRSGHSLRHDRYAGYLGELLTSLYFLANSDKMKIVHAEKVWMV